MSTQKAAVERSYRPRFQKYITFQTDMNRLLGYDLDKLCREAIHLNQLSNDQDISVSIEDFTFVVRL